MLNVLVNVCSVGMPSDHVSAPTIDSRPAFTRCLHQPASNRMSIHICQSVIPHHTTTVLRPFFREHPGEPVLEENFWSLWCKVRLTKADTPTHPAGCHSIWTNQCPAPPSPPNYFTCRMPFLPPNQQCQSSNIIIIMITIIITDSTWSQCT